MSENINKPIFAKGETLEQINEKARSHGLTYGYYVLARENGQYSDDFGIILEIRHAKRKRFCATRRRNNLY